jgi:TetR/AcrR family transcriptional repressor of nem operon
MDTESTRNRIVRAADQLFYQQGYDQTSFAQIAQLVGISRGNFYYHFKTKNDILDAVISQRLSGTRLMCQQWELAAETPIGRIRNFIGILMLNRSKIVRYGCPVGTLCSELSRLDHPAQDDANQLFTLFRTWLGSQFSALGFTDDADGMAMHLLALSQGVATLASAFHDEQFIRREVERLNEWLDTSVQALEK